MAEETRDIRGTVIRLFTQNPTFCAGKLLPVREDVTRGGEISFAGNCYVREGEAVTLRGQWTDHERFGRQFKVESRVHTEGIDAKGLAAWLAVHLAADGIGPVKAEKIAKEFGENFGGVLADNPEQIAIFAGVPLDNVRRLRDAWSAHEEENALGTKLAAYGLTAAQIHTLYAKFQGSITALLAENPYLLIGEIPGLGFGRVDDIAAKLGTPPSHPGRLQAALLYALGEFRDKGSTCAERQELLDTAAEALHATDDAMLHAVADALDGMEADGKRLKAVEVGEGGAKLYALPWPWKHETVVAAFLRAADRSNPHAARLCGPRREEEDPFGDLPEVSLSYPWDEEEDGPADDDGHLDSSDDGGEEAATAYDFDLDTAAVECVADECPELDESQRRAVVFAVKHRACLISGGAGSGKTTTVKAITRLYARAGLRIALCAPTGKAARRLEEVTGRQASTIHRLLEYMPRMGGFQRNAENPIDADVVIVDESSMVDVELGHYLFNAVGPYTAVVLVGDHHQLPPVGAGALLRDCIDREMLPLALLNVCHRQAGPLKQNCAAVLRGEIAPTVESPPGWPGPWYVQRRIESPDDVLACIEKLFTKIIPSWEYDPVVDVQFLTPIHAGPIGTQAVNALLQRLHQWTLGVKVEELPPGHRPKLHVRDKVIQTRNNYSLNVMNGHQGVVMNVNPLVVDFGERTVGVPNDCKGDIELAYCLTPHKVQGSEFPCVVAIYHKSHSFMTHRNHLYTAVTRAKQTCVLIGDEQGLRRAAGTVVANRRRTLLPVFMAGGDRGGGGRREETPANR